MILVQQDQRRSFGLGFSQGGAGFGGNQFCCVFNEPFLRRLAYCSATLERRHNGLNRCPAAVAMDFNEILGEAADDQLLAWAVVSLPTAKNDPSQRYVRKLLPRSSLKALLNLIDRLWPVERDGCNRTAARCRENGDYSGFFNAHGGNATSKGI
jgi:hypothetical protein